MKAGSRPPSAAETRQRNRMRAVVQDEYGSPDRLRVAEVDVPVPGPGEVLVRVRAAGVNPLDWHFVRGTPYFMRLMEGLREPEKKVRGVDVAGRVEAVGPNVTEFEPGDAVFGEAMGSFAEYATASVAKLAPKPDALTFDEAATLPTAGVTALAAFREEAPLRSGQRALINGASGGVGTFAVQIARSFGAEVAGVCSTRNVDLVRSLGADRVFDYTQEDFTLSGERYDVVLDLVGNRSPRELRRVLAPGGTLLLVSAGGGQWLGPLVDIVRAVAVSQFADHHAGWFVCEVTRADLEALAELVDAGDVRPVIDRTYPLADAPEALRYVEEGHASGKVVVSVATDEE